MLSVEERHMLAQTHEAALRAARALEVARPAGPERQIDAVLRCVIEAETQAREFYELLNQLTAWHEHPAVAEPGARR